MNDAETARPRQLCIFVLGMHRSGTSAVTRVLNLMGGTLPYLVAGAGPGNETGHWEPPTLVNLNDRILASQNRGWYDWRANRTPVRPEFVDELAAEIVRMYGDRTPFIVKDPRVSLLLPTYLDALASIGAGAVHVVMLRNPMATSASLAARDGMDVPRGQLLWLRYTLEAEYATRGLPRLFVRYDRMLRNWRSAMEPVAALTGLTLPPRDSEQGQAIEQFLDSGQRHHQPDQITADPPAGDWLLRANMALGLLAVDPADAGALAELDAVRAAFDDAAVLLEPSPAAGPGEAGSQPDGSPDGQALGMR